MSRRPAVFPLRPVLLALVVAGTLPLAACGNDREDAAAPASDAVAESRQEAREARRARRGEDRGEAELVVGDQRWTSSSASARKRDSGALSISAGSTRVEGQNATGARLSLSVAAYQGPGSYPAGMGSMWVRVGFNAEKAAQAEGSPDALNEVLSGATTVHLMQATIEIESEADGFITGSYHLPAAASRSGKEISGSFRARIRD